MSSWLRLRRQSNRPPTKHSAETIYADASGNLKVLGADGSVSDLGGNGGSQPGTVQVIKVPLTFADFGPGDDFGKFAPVYELQPGDVLLARGMRVTEVFDDSGPVTALQFYDASLAQGDKWTADNVLNPDDLNTGFVGLTATSPASDDDWGSQLTMAMTTTVAATLGIYANGMVGDGAAGAIDAYVVVATDIA